MKVFVSAVLFMALMGVMSCSNNVTGSSGSSTGSVDPNIAVNANFESGLTGWTATGTVSLVSNTNNGSLAAFMVTSIGTSGMAQYFAYDSNKTYVLSADLLDSAGYSKNMQIELCDMSSNSLAPRYYNYFFSTYWVGWVNQVRSLAPTNVSGFIKIYFFVNSDGGATPDMTVDNVVLTNY